MEYIQKQILMNAANALLSFGASMDEERELKKKAAEIEAARLLARKTGQKQFINNEVEVQKRTAKIISERAAKAANIRHKEMQQRKRKAIDHFIREYLETGISKNQFAKKYYAQYCVAEKTLRCNWLQGVKVQLK